MTDPAARTTVLFIGGLGRSGTTLLERLLGQLPGALPLGEVTHLWERDIRDDESCACGSAFSACEFWQRIGTTAFGGWDGIDIERVSHLRATVDRTRHIPVLAAKELKKPQLDLVREYAWYYHRVYAAAAADARAGVVIDSSKHASLAYVLRWCEEINLKVLHVVRDARGVAHSWTKKVNRPESREQDQMTRYSPARAAMLWNAQNAAFGLLRRRGVEVRRVRYEKLLSDPRGVVSRLANWAGIPATESQLRYIGDDYADLGPSHSAAGNPMRFTVGRIPLRHDDAWIDDMASSHRRIVSTLTRPLLGRYGYLSIEDPQDPPTAADPQPQPDDTSMKAKSPQ
ncbi:sulfotransferase family protein [Stackebrandtia endophytica]|uniref:Sulfotransferase family protein n=1 Tax=Stackebrandtia endophytica TaxID=1496996 RepID=A0A543ATV2_9ACTN|nr:sulfotransferase [Stackebrandtia endophytica]TQL76007.1 sulfotransferase family protein [Stackebrandtia endophytica]